VFCLVSAFAASAQVIQTARYELPAMDDNSEYKVLPWEEHGLIIYRRVEAAGNEDIFHLVKLDSAVQEHWVSSVSVQKQWSLAYAKCYGAKAHFLFRPRLGFGNFLLFSVDAESGSKQLAVIKNVIPFAPVFFEVSNKSLVIAGYYNYRPVAIHFSLVTGQSKLLPGFFNDPGELNQLTINPDETIDVVVNMRDT
jgi:hypothetical protein